MPNKEKGRNYKDVAAKYAVQKNTLSAWVKNKEKLWDSLEKESDIKLQNWEQLSLKCWTKPFSIGS